MTSKTFPGGWYCDATPNHNYVIVWADGRIEASGMAIPPPPNGAVLALFPRLRSSAVLEFAGQEWQAQDRAIVWNELNGWTVDGRHACGVSPCIYDNNGVLHVNVGCEVGSQGWRYVTPDNQLITGDATYGPAADWRLWEWTQLDTDLVVGQGENGGCLVWDRGQMRELIPESAGVCRFIRAWRDGDHCSVAYWGETGIPSAAYWLTVAELRALPLVQSFPPELPPLPIPPIEVPMILTAEFIESRPYAHVLGQGATPYERRLNALKFSNTVATDANAAEGRERYAILAGYGAESDVEGHKADIVCDRDTGLHYDVVIASEATTARPGFTNHGPVDPTRFRYPEPKWYIGSNPLPPVPQPPTPQPPTPPVPPVPGEPTNAQILAAVQALQADFDRVFRG